MGRVPNEPCLGRCLSSALPHTRHLGSKTRLLAFISGCLDEIGLVGGRALGAFAGTVTAGRDLRTHGLAVTVETLAAEAIALPERIRERELTPISVEGRGGVVTGSSPCAPSATSRIAR